MSSLFRAFGSTVAKWFGDPTPTHAKPRPAPVETPLTEGIRQALRPDRLTGRTSTAIFSDLMQRLLDDGIAFESERRLKRVVQAMLDDGRLGETSSDEFYMAEDAPISLWARDSKPMTYAEIEDIPRYMWEEIPMDGLIWRSQYADQATGDESSWNTPHRAFW